MLDFRFVTTFWRDLKTLAVLITRDRDGVIEGLECLADVALAAALARLAET